MDASLAFLFSDIYVFTPGRRIVAMGQVKKAAEAAGFADLATHAVKCIAYDRHVLELEAKWALQSAGTLVPPGLADLDNQVDRQLTLLRNTAAQQTEACEETDPLREQGFNYLQEMFPRGLINVIHAKYVDEAAQLERILTASKEAKWTGVVTAFALNRFLDRLGTMAVDYRKLVDTPVAGGMTFSEVRNARNEGQNLTLQAMSMILGKHPSESEADRAGRTALMGPILEQNDAVGRYLKARRSVPDVNPDTGQEIPDEKTSSQAGEAMTITDDEGRTVAPQP